MENINYSKKVIVNKLFKLCNGMTKMFSLFSLSGVINRQKKVCNFHLPYYTEPDRGEVA